MKKILTLLFFCTLTIVAKAQFYGDNKIHYYISSGESLDDDKTYIFYCKFYGRTMKDDSRMKYEFLRVYRENPSKLQDLNTTLEYISEYSTDARTTYKIDSHSTGWWGKDGYHQGPLDHYQCYAFSKDKSTMIRFNVKVNTGEIYEKVYYREISFDDIMPKGANKDFLYE